MCRESALEIMQVFLDCSQFLGIRIFGLKRFLVACDPFWVIMLSGSLLLSWQIPTELGTLLISVTLDVCVGNALSQTLNYVSR